MGINRRGFFAALAGMMIATPAAASTHPEFFPLPDLDLTEQVTLYNRDGMPIKASVDLVRDMLETYGLDAAEFFKQIHGTEVTIVGSTHKNIKSFDFFTNSPLDDDRHIVLTQPVLRYLYLDDSPVPFGGKTHIVRLKYYQRKPYHKA